MKDFMSLLLFMNLPKRTKDDPTGDGRIARSVTPSNDTLNMVMAPPHPLTNWHL